VVFQDTFKELQQLVPGVVVLDCFGNL
jgi:hypothetical protein